ncbi:MAG: hypothetical protein ACYTEX_09380 [Planctomycetota bacterium]
MSKQGGLRFLLRRNDERGENCRRPGGRGLNTTQGYRTKMFLSQLEGFGMLKPKNSLAGRQENCANYQNIGIGYV